ncbi:low temperature requirement protein A [Mycolicibacterium neworleansense]|uniref:Low temperature requirement protein LtrA n=1 Tax=Mycolicibacterium neworleansense TaxID=146018 RepID=A0A0H5RHY9_9MYCO|nr:low temperature requirement protein A [Mycolicibacterium neworleansense]MCV7362237.1 low temperature requirement protein A [Mycolicibacterium neworleansense]CRZ13356.1 low temperature requirement protein LtrA [Mycolicibacterium neworleansense]
MTGRDPHEPHRVATPLELLFDLTFVIAFGVAASQFAHLMAEGHVSAGLVGFGFAAFAIWWAWMNFTWFASAYDTDDWIYRVMTMLQMVGVIVLALGLPPMFASVDHGGHVDNAVMVAGYVVMRIALVGQWLRAAAQDPPRRSACLTYATVVVIAQIGWAVQIFVQTSVTVFFLTALVLVVVEISGPVLAERRMGGTPWHAHHVAERYGLLAIIALGEGVVGTVASLTAAVGEHGWSTDAILLVAAGIGLTFGMWWVYFLIPAGDLLHAHRTLSFWYGYLHLAVFGSIVATGAGLHVAAYYVEGHSHLSSIGTVLAVAIPVGIYLVAMFVIYSFLVAEVDLFHALLLVLASAALVTAVALAAHGTSMAICLLIVTAAPVAVVVGFEAFGHRHAAAIVDQRVGIQRPG